MTSSQSEICNLKSAILLPNVLTAVPCAREGPIHVVNLALIYAWVVRRISALQQLTIDASTPGGVSYGELKLDPTCDPLRGDPRL
jgi:hypothetical protein